MKKIISFVLVLVLSLTLFCACGKPAATQVSMYDLSRAMLDAAPFGEMNYVSSSDENAADLFAYLSDLDYGKVDAFFLSYAKDGKGNADEVAVIRVKDAADVASATASLQRHLDKRSGLYQTYDPTQSDKVAKGVVLSKNDLAVLIVHDDVNAIKEAFFAFLDTPAQS